MALGGENGDNYSLRSAEIYDPGLKSKIFQQLFCQTDFVTATNQWDPMPDMIEDRRGCSAVTIGDQIFVIGGCKRTEEALASIEVFDKKQQQWTYYTSLATPRVCARCHLAIAAILQAKTILPIRRAIVFEDRVYVLGGHDGTSVECFTPGPPGSRPRWHQVGWDSSTLICKPSSLLGGRYAGTPH